MWASFHILVSHLYIFFGNMSTQILCPFFNQLWFCYWVVWILYMPWIFVNVWLAIIISHSIGCLFILLIQFGVYFCFDFFSLLWLSDLKKKKLLPIPCQGAYCLSFYQDFYGFSCYIQIFDLLKVISCVWCKTVIQFLLRVAVQFSQHHLLKRGCLSFPHCIFLALLS